jgi:hypothetical protein
MLPAVQSQLRTQLLEQLRKLAGPDAVRTAGASGDQARSMWHTALNSMLAEYLQASNCQFTLSVFNSETDTVPGQPAFSTEELCQLLRLDRQPQLLQRVQELLPSQGVLLLLQLLLNCTCTVCTGEKLENYEYTAKAVSAACINMRSCSCVAADCRLCWPTMSSS